MKQEINSVYTVYDYRTGRSNEQVVPGDGQIAIKSLRKQHPRHTKFVLDGFEINGDYVPLYIKNRYND